MPLKMINAAAPEGTPLRRMKRVNQIFVDFHGLGANRIDLCLFLESIFFFSACPGNRDPRGTPDM
jgi:hypothetical protein